MSTLGLTRMFFLGDQKDIYKKLENLNPDELFNWLEEIPEDNVSELGDVSDDEIVEEEEITIPWSSLPAAFDIEAMPIIFDNELTMQVAAEPGEEEEEWSSDDEIPLSILRAREFSKKTIWTKSASNCLQIMKEFCEDSGPNIDSEVESPTDMFLQIFPDQLLEHMVFQTNLYALQKSGGNSKVFNPTNLKEMKCFIAINLAMGVKKLPSYRDYWSSRPELRDPFISSAMARDRFSWLLANLHLNDNSVQPGRDSPKYDKLYKVRPLLDILTDTYKNSLKPSKNQSIDESMIRFKGRSMLKQYMPNKPVKRGYKVWTRAEESGYICQFQIYTGKVGQIAETNLGRRVVEDLTRDLVGKGYHIYFDNFFNSVELQKSLQTAMIYACGTVRKGRKHLPTDIAVDKDLKRGESDWRVSMDGLTFVKWKDNRPVQFLSNYLNPTEIDFVPRKKKDGSVENIACPGLVKLYNTHMGYVDKADMFKSLYEVDRKSKKWWHRILFHFIDLSLVNACILYKKRTDSPTQLNLKDFRMSVALGLVGAELNVMKKGRPTKIVHHFKRTVPYEVRYDSCAHMPIHGKPGRCGFCSSNAEPHKSRWHCTR